MIFSEIYGSYFKTVSEILGRAVSGDLTGRALTAAVQNSAFGESIMTIPANLSDGTWPLLNRDLTTPLEHAPSMPLTTLQKQWLKALLLDPRVRLFQPSEEGLEDVEPLFTPDMFVYFDRCGDGDPFESEEYIRNFRLILTAVKERKKVRISFESGRNILHNWIALPGKLEYSPKDDRFRVICSRTGERPDTINLGRIRSVELLEGCPEEKSALSGFKWKPVVMTLTDERNALERCMLHFSDLEKETVKLDEKHYRITLHYMAEDETEILIRILSFGAVLKVIEPESFIDLIRERLMLQSRYESRQK